MRKLRKPQTRYWAVLRSDKISTVYHKLQSHTVIVYNEWGFVFLHEKRVSLLGTPGGKVLKVVCNSLIITFETYVCFLKISALVIKNKKTDLPQSRLVTSPQTSRLPSFQYLYFLAYPNLLSPNYFRFEGFPGSHTKTKMLLQK